MKAVTLNSTALNIRFPRIIPRFYTKKPHNPKIQNSIVVGKSHRENEYLATCFRVMGSGILAGLGLFIFFPRIIKRIF